MATKERIIEAADQLFYQQGFEHTSFAGIAKQVNISRGNFYHHFKSKDEILDAVINLRLQNTQAMLEQWELKGDNAELRITSFIQILITNQAKIKQFGCPVGTLTTELSKLGHPAQDKANQLFTLFRVWLERQFIALGLEAVASQLAMHLLARSQGVATLASAFQDEEFIQQEVKLLQQWLQLQLNQNK